MIVGWMVLSQGELSFGKKRIERKPDEIRRMERRLHRCFRRTGRRISARVA